MISLPEGLYYAECEGLDQFVTTRECRLNAAIKEIKEYVRKYRFIDGNELEMFLSDHGISIESLSNREISRIESVLK